MKTLFFINNTMPTKEEFDFASTIEGKVCFRNVQFMPHDISEGSIEKCDQVCGQVPEVYSLKFNVLDFENKTKQLEIKPKSVVKKTEVVWKPNK